VSGPRDRWRRLFPRGKPLIGMVHLAPLPGSPGWGGDWRRVLNRALEDAERLVAGGMDGLLVENFHDVPFFPGRTPAATVAAMAVIADRLAERFPDTPLGVNVLRNDGLSALELAAAVPAVRFIRVNVLCGAMLTDQGIIQGIAHLLLRRRRELGLETAILADVQVKHAAPLAPRSLLEDARDTLLRGGADALIASGAATGRPVDFAQLIELRGAAGDAPLLAGSGVSPENLPGILRIADGAIVGSWLKERGDVHRPVDPERVRRLVRLRAAAPQERA